jgi:type IV pilus assembly protein PilV
MNSVVTRRRQGGMTLVEVLVSVLIFSFGLVGLVGLQGRALQFSTSAEDTNRAALLANEITAKMTITQAAPTSSDLTTWQTRVADPTSGGLPNGSGTVSTDATTGLTTITITWRAPNAVSGTPDNRYTTQYKVVP